MAMNMDGSGKASGEKMPCGCDAGGACTCVSRAMAQDRHRTECDATCKASDAKRSTRK